MDSKILIAIVLKHLEDTLSSPEFINSLPMKSGKDGKDGRDFVFEDHADRIKSIISESVPKFSDFTEEQIAALRGPRGRDGKDGRDFDFEASREQIEKIISDKSLKFEDLSPEQIDSIRGPKGRDGKDGRHGIDGAPGKDGVDGRDFVFEDDADRIKELVVESVISHRPSLTEDERQELRGPRGPRGQRGSPGKGFCFEDHRGEIERILEEKSLKFEDLSEAQVESLKLKFSDLTDSDKVFLKLKFSDLTPEDKLELIGPRGPAGKKGSRGDQGEKGDQGIQGPHGPRGEIGPRGLPGKDGKNGQDGEKGEDAPTIESIEILEHSKDEISMVLTLSDGSEVESNRIPLPKSNIYNHYYAAGIGTSGGQANTMSQRDKILFDKDVVSIETIDDVGTIHERISKIEYSTPNYPTGLVEQFISYTFTNLRYKISSITWVVT